MAKIQYTTPEGTTGEVEFVADRMSFGRAEDNVLVIPDGSVSSHHGEIVLDGDQWILTDLGSTNGTKVNEERVEQLQLTHGAAFQLGNVDCVFVGDAPAPAAEEYYAPPTRAAAPTTGYGSQAIDRSRRTGFGAKTKEKNSGGALVMLVGVIGLLACGAAVFMFNGMTL